MRDIFFDASSLLTVASLGALLFFVMGAAIKFKLFKRNINPFLNRRRQKVMLSDKSIISHDTRLFRFSLENNNQLLGLPVGKHIKLFMPSVEGHEAGKWNGKEDTEYGFQEIERKYTPVNGCDSNGFLELIVKIYKQEPALGFPDGGKMSQYLDKLKIGDYIELQGPFGMLEYLGRGTFNLLQRKQTFKKFGLLAGGSGITPMWQLIRTVANDNDDNSNVSLIYANKSEKDILLADELEEITEQYSDRFKIWYTVEQAPPHWNYSVGYITADMIRQHLPPPSEDLIILCCGPPPMVKFACKANLEKCGYHMKNVFEF